ncbi:MAG TPA: DUF3040 domain-containing protein [Trebonia sp.]|jgi:hypothetical protein|nr:DUF3040 domain-containing protein [Trebonia sp.]
MDAMALSMDEERMLAEIERRLAAEDPGLATRLASFRRSGPGAGLRTPKGRLIMLSCMIAVIATVSAVIYVLVPFSPQSPPAPSNQVSHSSVTSVTSGGTGGVQRMSASDASANGQ